MANTVYDNFVLENKVTDLLNTKLDARKYMTIDYSLATTAGLKKMVNTYTYAGKVEKLVKGAKNTTRGALTFTQKEYEVEKAQQVWDYYDEEFMADPTIVDSAVEGMTSLMINDMTSKFFAELAKATLKSTWAQNGKINYDALVDAIQVMNVDDETGIFVVVGNDLKADLRKDPDFKASRQGEILYTGQIGSISGLPVVYSKACDKGTGYVATPAAVTLFTKKESEVEQARDGEAGKNTIIMRKVNLVALTDATKVVKVTEATA